MNSEFRSMIRWTSLHISKLSIDFHGAAQDYVLLLHAPAGSRSEMVLFALIVRNPTIKQEKDENATPKPWGFGWSTFNTYQSIVTALQAFDQQAFFMPEQYGWQFSIVVEEFDLQEPEWDRRDSEARLKLPYKWMYDCCTLHYLSGLANDDQVYLINNSTTQALLHLQLKRKKRFWSPSTSSTEPLRNCRRVYA